MNNIFQKSVVIFSLFLLFTLGISTNKASAQYENAFVSYNDFYDNLAPFGQWIEDPKMGYVWSPSVDGSFRPYYSNGHWAMTEYGNTWISDFSWGWACFHYGRWTYDSYYGWLWIPGNNWGPAWVSWRYTDGFYGWAPLGPNYEFTNTYGDYSCPNDWWVFIPSKYIYTGNYYRYWYGPHGNSHIISNSHFINNTYETNHITYVHGPRRGEIEYITHQPVQVFNLKHTTTLNTKVHNNEIRMFRPNEIRPSGGERVSPPNVVTAPKPIRSSQPVNAGQTTPPQFRHDIPPANVKQEIPGTNINKTAEPAKPAPRYDNNPYEWDVNRPQPQPKKAPEYVPQQEESDDAGPAPVRQPRAAPMPQPRQAPAPQPRQAPAPQQQQPRTNVAPQQAPRTAPAPQVQPANGRRK